MVVDLKKGSKTIAIICARGGSKGLPRKNLKELDGTPLIGRVVEKAVAIDCIDTVIVSTDDAEIAKVAEDFGAEIPFIRRASLAEDLTTTEDTLQHALLTYEKLNDIEYDICVFLTPTDVFSRPEWISEAVNQLKNSPHLESVFVGYKTHKNFWEQQDDGSWLRVRPWMASYSSRQIRRSIVREDTGLACASRAWLWREGRRVGDKVQIIVNDDDFTGIDIHAQEDLDLAEAAIKIRNKVDQ
jgi:CMP-N,N'-diacetyllegionaminic acid synthase